MILRYFKCLKKNVVISLPSNLVFKGPIKICEAHPSSSWVPRAGNGHRDGTGHRTSAAVRAAAKPQPASATQAAKGRRWNGQDDNSHGTEIKEASISQYLKSPTDIIWYDII